jgi:putative endonuclease
MQGTVGINYATLLYMPYYVYILECADTSLYTGSTNDLDKRVKAHNESKTGARYTKARRPVVLRYAEEYPSVGEALSREAEIKQMSRKEKLALLQ